MEANLKLMIMLMNKLMIMITIPTKDTSMRMDINMARVAKVTGRLHQ